MLTPMTEKQFTDSLVSKCARQEVTIARMKKQIARLEDIIKYGLGEKDLEQDI